MSKETKQSNPANAGSSENFFNEMDRQVNGAILDEDQQVNETTLQNSGPAQVTHIDNGDPQQNNVDWEKRYKDSSREATKMAGQLNALKPFVPLLKAMKQDSGLVDTVKDYLTNGGQPAKPIKERLGLSEDFIFDQEEAFNSPDSDSAKLLNAHVDGIVGAKVNKMMQQQQAQAQQQHNVAARNSEIQAFKEKNNMSDEEFNAMMVKSKERKMTLDDVNYLVNREKAASNIANSTKAEMMNQMNKVRDIPATASGVNSPRAEKSMDDQIFDDLMESGAGVDELFG